MDNLRLFGQKDHHVASDDNFSLVPSAGGSILSLDEFTFVRTVTNAFLRSLEKSFRNGQRRADSPNVDVDHVSLVRMKPGESVSLMYWMNTLEYLKDWEMHVSDVQQHVHTDAHRLHCRIQSMQAKPEEILEYAKEWPTGSADQKLIYAAGTATCVGSIAQLVSFGLLDEEILLCEQQKNNGSVNSKLNNPLMTRICEYRKANGPRVVANGSRLMLFDASKVLSCCKITQEGAIEYGTCSMHVFRDPENPDQMVLLADILRVPTSPAGRHTFLSPISVSALSEIMYDSIHSHFEESEAQKDREPLDVDVRPCG
jgi:hypothetical protein